MTLNADTVRSFYDRHGAALTAFAGTFTGDFASAEDAVHRVFLNLLRGNIAIPSSPLAYLYTAVRNAALNTHRDRKRDRPLDPEACCFLQREGDREAILALQQALSQLPDDQREVIFMRVWSGMTLEEIAAAIDISVNTVSSRYRYALEKLRHTLKPLAQNKSHGG